jgi:hypothetical protein
MRKDGACSTRACTSSPAGRPQGPADRLDDQHDQHHRSQAHPRPAGASHERFTTVLEGLDASVSVLSVQQGELLFANRSLPPVVRRRCAAATQLLAGDDGGHVVPTVADMPTRILTDALGGLPTQELTAIRASNPREVFVEPLQKWFDVRVRATCNGPMAGWRRC